MLLILLMLMSLSMVDECMLILKWYSQNDQNVGFVCGYILQCSIWRVLLFVVCVVLIGLCGMVLIVLYFYLLRVLMLLIVRVSVFVNGVRLVMERIMIVMMIFGIVLISENSLCRSVCSQVGLNLCVVSRFSGVVSRMLRIVLIQVILMFCYVCYSVFGSFFQFGLVNIRNVYWMILVGRLVRWDQLMLMDQNVSMMMLVMRVYLVISQGWWGLVGMFVRVVFI